MCLCEGGKCLDTCCCSLRAKAIFLGGWTLAVAVILLIGAIMQLGKGEFFFDILLMVGMGLIVVHLIGGILLLLGVFKKLATIFLAGIIMSSFLPYYCIASVVLPVIQIIFTITACRYHALELK